MTSLKQEFKDWLTKKNHPVLNEMGINKLVSKLDTKLAIQKGSRAEKKLLAKLRHFYRQEKMGLDELAINDSLNQYINMLF